MKKQRILTSQAAPGMKIADDVYTPSGQLIISAATAVTDKVITRLKFYSIHQITIEVDDDTPDEPVAPVAYQTEPYSQKIKKTNEFKLFSSALAKSTEHLHQCFNNIVEQNQKINEDEMISEVNSVMSCARNGMHIFDMLHSMRNYDDETYLHSINVALISCVLGRWMNFTRQELDTLILCGLMHDIGKIIIPHEIIHKPGRLTEEEYATIKTHSVRGYNILRAQNANIHVQMTAMMHHERCDGSGYPMGIKGNQIDRFAKIVMIADVYDAMTSARVYRGPLCPFEVISIFESEGLAKYDTRAVMTFLEHVNQTYLHNTVRLSNQSIGEIVMMNQTILSRPVIQVGSRFIDLSREPGLYIEAIL